MGRTCGEASGIGKKEESAKVNRGDLLQRIASRIPERIATVVSLVPLIAMWGLGLFGLYLAAPSVFRALWDYWLEW